MAFLIEILSHIPGLGMARSVCSLQDEMLSRCLVPCGVAGERHDLSGHRNTRQVCIGPDGS